MNLYQTCYDLIVQYVFNGEELSQLQDLVVTWYATAAWLFCAILPFLLVLWMIRTVLSCLR